MRRARFSVLYYWYLRFGVFSTFTWNILYICIYYVIYIYIYYTYFAPWSTLKPRALRATSSNVIYIYVYIIYIYIYIYIYRNTHICTLEHTKAPGANGKLSQFVARGRGLLPLRAGALRATTWNVLYIYIYIMLYINIYIYIYILYIFAPWSTLKPRALRATTWNVLYIYIYIYMYILCYTYIYI